MRKVIFVGDDPRIQIRELFNEKLEVLGARFLLKEILFHDDVPILVFNNRDSLNQIKREAVSG